jgi:hypothetical protein
MKQNHKIRNTLIVQRGQSSLTTTMDYLMLQDAAVNGAYPSDDHGVIMIRHDAAGSVVATSSSPRASTHRRMSPLVFDEMSFFFMPKTKHRRSTPIFDDSSSLLISQLLIKSQIEPDLFTLLKRRGAKLSKSSTRGRHANKRLG